MLSKIQSLGCRGVSGYAVSVECHVSNGLPGFDIVGLPDAAVKAVPTETKDGIVTKYDIENAKYKGTKIND